MRGEEMSVSDESVAAQQGCSRVLASAGCVAAQQGCALVLASAGCAWLLGYRVER